MKKTLYLLCAMLALASVACSKGEEPQDEPKKSYYWNPVIGNDCPDPTVIDDRARTGYFYAFSTKAYVAQIGSSMNIPIYKSENM